MLPPFSELWAKYRQKVFDIYWKLSGGKGSRWGRQVLMSAGQTGLWQASLRWKPEDGEFWAFAWQRVRGAMIDTLRDEGELSRTLRARVKEGDVEDRPWILLYPQSFDTLMTDERFDSSGLSPREESLAIELHHALLARQRDNPEDEVARREMLRQIDSALGKIRPKDRALIEAVYVDGRLLVEIARESGVTESRICQRLGEAMGILRGVLAEEGFVMPDPSNSNGLYEFRGESLTVTQWAAKTGIHKQTIYHRLRCGWPIDKVLTTPVKTRQARLSRITGFTYPQPGLPSETDPAQAVRLREDLHRMVEIDLAIAKLHSERATLLARLVETYGKKDAA